MHNKLQYTWRRDYCECVQPAQLPILTWSSSSIPPGTTLTLRSLPGTRSTQQRNLPNLPVIVSENCNNFQQRSETLEFGVISSCLTIYHPRFLDKIWNRVGVSIRYDIVQITIIYTPLNYCQFHYRMIITVDKSLTTNLLTCKCPFCPPIAQIILIRQASTSISAIHDKLNNQINTSSNVPSSPCHQELWQCLEIALWYQFFGQRINPHCRLLRCAAVLCHNTILTTSVKRGARELMSLKRHRVYKHANIIFLQFLQTKLKTPVARKILYRWSSTLYSGTRES